MFLLHFDTSENTLPWVKAGKKCSTIWWTAAHIYSLIHSFHSFILWSKNLGWEIMGAEHHGSEVHISPWNA